MELDITDFFNSVCAPDLSASQAELGVHAGAITWHASMEAAQSTHILDTEDKRDAFRSWVRSSGGWTMEKIEAWSDTELDALCLQWIARDMRQCGADDAESFDWDEYEQGASEGQYPSNLYRGDDGRIYFSLSN